jgi:hypothetical protein
VHEVSTQKMKKYRKDKEKAPAPQLSAWLRSKRIADGKFGYGDRHASQTRHNFASQKSRHLVLGFESLIDMAQFSFNVFADVAKAIVRAVKVEDHHFGEVPAAPSPVSARLLAACTG